MQTFGLCAAYLLTLLLGAAGECTWTQCYTFDLTIDPCGSRNMKDQKGCQCKNIPFVGKTCAGTQYQCCDCISGVDCECDWWDASCNWDALQDYMYQPSEKQKQQWDQLSRTVQDKVRTEEYFITLTEEELKSIGADLLGQLKAVSAMTPIQFQQLKEKMSTEMTDEQFKDLLSHIDTAVLAESLPNIKSGTWNLEKAKAIINHLKTNSEYSGEVVTWSAATLDKLGPLLSGLNVTELGSISLEAFEPNLHHFRDFKWGKGTLDRLQVVTSKSKALFGDPKAWTTEQLNKIGSGMAGLTEKELPKINFKLVVAMDDEVFLDIDWTVNPNSLKVALPTMVQVPGWGAKVKSVITALRDASVWGHIAHWTSQQIDSLGTMLGDLEVEDLMAMDDAALAKMVKFYKLSQPQLVAIGEKLFSPAAMDAGSAKRLTGLASISLDAVLDAVPVAKFKAALVWLGSQTKWTVDQAKILHARITHSEVLGAVTQWSATQMRDLGTLLTPLLQADADAEGANNYLVKVDSEKFAQVCDVLAAGAEFVAPGLEVLVAKAKEAFGPCGSWSKDQLVKLGPVLTPLGAELKSISAEVLKDAVPLLAQRWTWTGLVAGDLAARLKSSEVYGAVNTWTKETLTELGPMLGAVLETDIMQLSNVVFRGSLPLLSTACQWTMPQLQLLAQKAKVAFGPITQWTIQQFRDLGVILAGLDWQDFPKFSVNASVTLDPVTVDAMSPQQAAAMPTPVIAAMPANVRGHLTAEYLTAMDSDQRKAAVCGSEDRACSGNDIALQTGQGSSASAAFELSSRKNWQLSDESPLEANRVLVVVDIDVVIRASFDDRIDFGQAFLDEIEATKVVVFEDDHDKLIEQKDRPESRVISIVAKPTPTEVQQEQPADTTVTVRTFFTAPDTAREDANVFFKQAAGQLLENVKGEAALQVPSATVELVDLDQSAPRILESSAPVASVSIFAASLFLFLKLLR